MPPLPPGLWSVDIEKSIPIGRWTNRYIVSAADLAAAAAIGNSIAQLERAVTQAGVIFTKIRTSDGQPETDVYQIQNLNQLGLWAGSGSELVPIFVVARVDFNTAGGGRPSRKYLRCVLEEADITMTTILTAAVNRIQNSFVTPMVNLAGYVDVDGQEITSGSVFPQPAMRQVRRASKRKTDTSNNPIA